MADETKNQQGGQTNYGSQQGQQGQGQKGQGQHGQVEQSGQPGQKNDPNKKNPWNRAAPNRTNRMIRTATVNAARRKLVFKTYNHSPGFGRDFFLSRISDDSTRAAASRQGHVVLAP